MLKLDDLLKTGMTIGVVGGTILAAALVPGVARSSKPAARAALKSGLVLFERGREMMAEAHEELEDMLAEVRSELQHERSVKDAEIGGVDIIAAAGDEQP